MDYCGCDADTPSTNIYNLDFELGAANLLDQRDDAEG